MKKVIKSTVVDNVLNRYGWVWKTNPYRIEDQNGTIIQYGSSFDMTPKTLNKQFNAYLDKRKSFYGTRTPS
jgi:hypothetical protein